MTCNLFQKHTDLYKGQFVHYIDLKNVIFELSKNTKSYVWMRNSHARIDNTSDNWQNTKIQCNIKLDVSDWTLNPFKRYKNNHKKSRSELVKVIIWV